MPVPYMVEYLSKYVIYGQEHAMPVNCVAKNIMSSYINEIMIIMR